MILIWPIRCTTEWETFKERKRNEQKNQEVDESDGDDDEVKESNSVKMRSNEHMEAEFQPEEPKGEESPSKTKNEDVKESDENNSLSLNPKSQGRKPGICQLDDLFQSPLPSHT